MKKILSAIVVIAMIAMLSVSVFAADENLATTATVNAPFCSGWENAAAINDGAYPEGSFSADGYTHYGSWGSATDNYETLSYSWDSEVTVDSIGLYFWRDTADRPSWVANGGINYPAAYTVQYWNGTEYVDVTGVVGGGVDEDVMNQTFFDEVTTTSLQFTLIKFTADEDAEHGFSAYAEYTGDGTEAGAPQDPSTRGMGLFEIEVYASGTVERPE